MTKKMVALSLIAIGSVAQIISLAADFLGLGLDPNAIGWKQLSGAGLGLVIIWVGVYLLATSKAPVSQ
jgi:hypothetical protein